MRMTQQEMLSLMYDLSAKIQNPNENMTMRTANQVLDAEGVDPTARFYAPGIGPDGEKLTYHWVDGEWELKSMEWDSE